MQVEYADDARPNLKQYVDRKTNRIDFEREEALTIARRIAGRGGYARVLFGGNVYATFGNDPRHI